MIRIATRKSKLALWQANHVQALLHEAHAGIQIELVPIVTEGDRIIDRPLAAIGGKGLFLKELEKALLDGKADLAVHSMKDVPAAMTPGLVLDVVLPRANPFDALVSSDNRTLAELPAGSIIGTSSLRRQSQLLALRPDLVVNDLRGNVDTRLGKLDAGQYDAIILACAGLERLDLGARISETLRPPDWLPASTQGIIALQWREDDAETAARLAPLAHADTLVIATAERTVARVLEASCQVPLAVYAVLKDEILSLAAKVGTSDGQQTIQAARQGAASEAQALGERVASDLLKYGAGDIIADL